ncbi:hexosyltransferase [Cytophagales bacterium WSM2-2]|nr:hexosyltransferase [Cytophagales bacterium WSM2-2]
MKRKIAIIVPGGFGTGKNNAGIPVLEQIVKHLSSEFDITVFQLFRVNDSYRPDGIDLFGFDNRDKFVQYWKLFWSFRNTHHAKKFQAIHGFWAWPCGFIAVVLGKIFKIKSIVSVLGGDGSSVPEINYGHLHRFIYRKAIVWGLQNAGAANALTKYLADNLHKAGLRRNLSVIPWGVDADMFLYKEKSFNNPIRFLHVANFHPVKDQITLLKVFSLVHQSVNCTLTLIGEGEEESNIKKLIEELGIQKSVNIVHHMPYTDLPKYYHESDILLHTSLSEGQSEVVTEAMSCGVLVCGTKVGLMYDLPESCISVQPKDHEGLAHQILAIINKPAEGNKIRQNARAWTSVHDLTWTVAEIKKLYL